MNVDQIEWNISNERIKNNILKFIYENDLQVNSRYDFEPIEDKYLKPLYLYNLFYNGKFIYLGSYSSKLFGQYNIFIKENYSRIRVLGNMSEREGIFMFRGHMSDRAGNYALLDTANIKYISIKNIKKFDGQLNIIDDLEKTFPKHEDSFTWIA